MRAIRHRHRHRLAEVMDATVEPRRVGRILREGFVVGVAAGRARIWVGRSPRRLAAIGGTSGIVMIGLGVRLAVTGKKD